MGKGRRMKKQGPPAQLDESTINMLKKRKAGNTDTKPELGKKRRRAELEDEENVSFETSNKKVNGSASGGPKTARKSSAKEVKSQDKNKWAGKKASSPDSDEEANSWEDEDISESDADGLLEDDEFDDLEGVSDDSMNGEDDENSNSDTGVEEEDSVWDSDDEDHPRQAMFSDDEDYSDAEEKLTAANIEGLSRKLDAQTKAEQEEAEQDLRETAMQTNIASDRPDVFAEGEAAGLAPDLQLLRTRITDSIRILGDLKTLGQPGKSRTDYVDLLIKDISTYYGYTPFLAEKLFSLFTPMEAFAFFEANETPRPVVIRTNTLRTNRRSLAQALINRGVVLEPVGKWSKVGLQVFESAVPLGATPEYLAGHYILQAASSFLPVMALAPQPNERVLDMAAAPGGKTTYISALLRNTGCVIANDASKPRAKGLIGNIHRLGCRNTIVTNLDARTAFPKAMGGFDRILLDAPCTGTGVISKDPSVKTSKNERDFLAIPHMQRQLLLAAIDSVDHSSKTGGYVVYSTCSVTVEENESVVQYILRKRPNVKIVDTGLGDFGSEGFIGYMGKQFDPKMKLTRRYFPHRENVDGFFVCKLKKTGPSPAPKKGSADGASASPGTADKSSKDHITAGEDDAVVDRTPIADEDGTVVDVGGAFGPFDDDEDAERIARAERSRLRRKGINPKAVLNKTSKTKLKTNGSSKQGTEPQSAKQSESEGATLEKKENAANGQLVKSKSDGNRKTDHARKPKKAKN